MKNLNSNGRKHVKYKKHKAKNINPKHSAQNETNTIATKILEKIKKKNKNKIVKV